MRFGRTADGQRRWAGVTLLLGVTLFAAACSSDNNGSGTPKPEEKVELSFWTWVPNIDKVVEKWNASHPNIHVTASNHAQGDELVTKLS